MNIRLENENDYYEVENLTREAFWNVYRPGCFEHYLLHKLRNEECFVKELDYIIEEQGRIIASIVYAKGNLKSEDGRIQDVLLFGPVSVLPEYQHRGYGKKLIEYTMQKAKELGFNEVVITGNPDYYKKYGFESASKYGIYYANVNQNEELPFFMICILNEGNNIPKGIYSDPKCYLDIDKEKLEEFDKNFPFKIKEKREGQLE